MIKGVWVDIHIISPSDSSSFGHRNSSESFTIGSNFFKNRTMQIFFQVDVAFGSICEPDVHNEIMQRAYIFYSH